MFCDSAMLSGLRGPAVWLIMALGAVIADLATTTGTTRPEAIGVARAEAVIFASGALGCPEPDRLYTQAQVPGFRIVLALDGRY